MRWRRKTRRPMARRRRVLQTIANLRLAAASFPWQRIRLAAARTS